MAIILFLPYAELIPKLFFSMEFATTFKFASYIYHPVPYRYCCIGVGHENNQLKFTVFNFTNNSKIVLFNVSRIYRSIFIVLIPVFLLDIVVFIKTKTLIFTVFAIIYLQSLPKYHLSSNFPS